MRNVPGSHTLKEWADLCAKFKHRCVKCGLKRRLTKDHVIPLTHEGSTDDISNIQPLCLPCNSGKRDWYAADYRRTPFVNCGQIVMF